MSVNEVDLCRRLTGWLKSKGYEPHHEVSVSMDGRVRPVDVVTTEGAFIVCYEGKLTLDDALVNQCKRRRTCFHRVWAVVPTSGAKMRRSRNELLLKRYGIGLITIGGVIETVHPARINTHAEIGDVVRAMSERQKRGNPPAGSAGVRRVRQDGLDRVRTLLGKEPGLSGKELRQDLGMSADEYRDLWNRARKGRVDGVRCEGSPAKVYPTN